MKQLLQSEFNKGGKTYKNVSSPETSGTQSQVTTIILDGSVLKISTDNGATFLDIVTTQSNTNANEIDGIQNQISTMLSDIGMAVANIANLTSNTTLIKNSDGGFSAGDGASATYGGAVGKGATETASGGAVGAAASATNGGGAVGAAASATNGGGAVGNAASATNGGAVGQSAKAGNGFSGGYTARVGKDNDGNYIDAIQLGTGDNNTPRTLQVYNHKVYNSTNDSLYCRLLNDKTPAVIETVWDGTLTNDGSTTITVSNYSQYDYFILFGSTLSYFSVIIQNMNGTYAFAKKAITNADIMAYSFVYKDGSFTWDQAGYYPNGNFTFVDKTGTGIYSLYTIAGVKICKA